MTDSQTTELREKLTERGVKWWPMRNNGYYEDRDTEFVANGKKHTAHEWGDGLAIYNLTPEQAIAATLGRGECCITKELSCSKCGYQYPRRNCEQYETEDGHLLWKSLNREVIACDMPNYCPNCGAKVVI